MERETKIEGFDIFSSDGGWRARLAISSTIGEPLEDSENFSADLNLPINNPNTTPDEIQKEIYGRFVHTFEEILEQLKKIVFP